MMSIKENVCSVCLFSVFFVSGCNSNPAIPDDPQFAPVPPQAMMAPPKSNGSLYREGYGLSLFEDTTARRVGDILTVRLVENFSSETSSEHSLEKDSDITMANPTILGGTPNFTLPGILPLDSTTGDYNASLSIDSEAEGTGKNSSKQSGRLSTGTITVNVIEVMPNGNLKVRGEKWLTLNNDKQYIRLSGIVRPDDISEDNSVESIKIADARIAYNGTGTVSESNIPGWLTKFFMSAVWPF